MLKKKLSKFFFSSLTKNIRILVKVITVQNPYRIFIKVLRYFTIALYQVSNCLIFRKEESEKKTTTEKKDEETKEGSNVDALPGLYFFIYLKNTNVIEP